MGSRSLGVALAAPVAGLALAGVAGAGELAAHGLVTGTVVSVESRESWISGSFGRLSEGRRPDGFVGFTRGEAQLAVEWKPSATWLFRLHGLARSEPDAAGGERAGLTEGLVQYRPELRPDLALRLRAGLMFLPTSRENVDPLWQSPYTLTLSAINTWIGEELRPLGLDVAAQLGEPGGTSRLELAGMVFGAADTAGTLTAWRGWSMGTRLSVVDEVLPLPPLPTLAPGGLFASQLDSGTRPIDELDGRPGWHVRGRWSGGGGLLQAAWTDTRGDRGLHRGQYAWATRFASLGAELQLGAVRLVAEAVDGTTGMGTKPDGVDAGFRAGYALATWSAAGERLRLSARYDRFRNEDEDGHPEPNDESGYAWTFAGFYAPRPWLRLGFEYLVLRSDRPAAAFSGTEASTDGDRAQAELRLRF